MQSIKRHQGITLIELLIAITVVIVLTVTAVPSFLFLYQEYRLNTLSTNLYYLLRYARSSAVENNQSIYVNFKTGSNWCYGINAGSSCNCSTANSCTLGTYFAPDATTSLSTTGLLLNNLVFDGVHGAASSSIITFTLTSGTTAMGVSVGAMGNTRVCSNQVSGYPTCP